jgi:hypothetical protein
VARYGVVAILSGVEIADEEEHDEPHEDDGQQPGTEDVARSRSHAFDLLQAIETGEGVSRAARINRRKCGRGPATPMAGPL